MKVLFASDSHLNKEFFYNTIKNNNPDIVVFAGDHSLDAIEMAYIFENIKFIIVRGNTDYQDYETKDIELFEIEGLGRVFLTHGHLYNVKSTMKDLKKEVKNKEVDLVVFGHTHRQYLEEEIIDGEKIIYLNPGAMIDEKYAIYSDGELKLK